MILQRTFAALALTALALPLGFAAPLAAQGTLELRATIWVDPDGCEHWVMDTGIEGFMSPHMDRDGKPVCRRQGAVAGTGACKVLNSDNLFGVGSARISKAAKTELATYFQSIAGSTVIVDGHTDNSGSDELNLDLSLKRALAVAAIAGEANVTARVRGFGEQIPVATNANAAGRSLNRRVEISCAVAE